MQEENDQVSLQVEKARRYSQPGFEHGLKHFESRFDGQRQVIGLLSSQLDELCASYEKEGGGKDPVFIEQVNGFKTDIDRVALLFSRLKTQFKAYLDEYMK